MYLDCHNFGPVCVWVRGQFSVPQGKTEGEGGVSPTHDGNYWKSCPIYIFCDHVLYLMPLYCLAVDPFNTNFSSRFCKCKYLHHHAQKLSLRRKLVNISRPVKNVPLFYKSKKLWPCFEKPPPPPPLLLKILIASLCHNLSIIISSSILRYRHLHWNIYFRTCVWIVLIFLFYFFCI